MSNEDQTQRPAILAEITSAFDGVRLGKGVSLHQARNLDDLWCDDPHLREKDPEISWTELTDEKMRFFSDVFVFLDAEGFRFYVPAFMSWVLRDAADGLDWSFCFALCGFTNPAGYEPPSSIVERLALLTPAQIASIGRFVEYESRNDAWLPEALAAWEHFWRELTPRALLR